MFKQAKGEKNSQKIPMKPAEAYKISPDDKISFSLATNNGAKLIEGISGVSGGAGRGSLVYLVRSNGFVELPVLGKVEVAGLTIEECEDKLVDLFSVQYKEPFVQVTVTNNRIIIFPGNGSSAKVVALSNPNTTLMESIALAGGIAGRGKANTVKLMRVVEGKREIYIMDLSTIEGLKYADMLVQANDYIYIEPTAEIASGIIRELAPIVSLI
ncbi:MAG: polysaccharide biosynthesis/export family protein, partial [Flavobacteriales bacterium]|nr:polysaccharide biosynthesis/export family protein [Flavobacteriales bacterium]